MSEERRSLTKEEAGKLMRLRLGELYKLDPIVTLTLAGQEYKLEFTLLSAEGILKDTGFNLLSENYAEKLLSKAMGDPEMMEGKKITHQAVIAALKLLEERNKIRKEESVMKQAFMKLFRGKGVDLPKEVTDELQTVLKSDTN